MKRKLLEGNQFKNLSSDEILCFNHTLPSLLFFETVYSKRYGYKVNN